MTYTTTLERLSTPFTSPDGYSFVALGNVMAATDREGYFLVLVLWVKR